MGSSVAGITALSALLVPMRKLDREHVIETSTFVESNPATNRIEPDEGVTSALAFTPAGNPEDGRDIQLRVQRGGVPSGLNGLALAWRNTSSEDWFGWDSFPLITQYRQVAWSQSTTLGYQNPDVCALPNGTLICAFDEPSATDQRAVKVRRWTPDALAWDAASTTVYAESAANVAVSLHPCLLRMPSGRVLLFHLYHRGSDTQVWTWYSDDDGVTWERGQRSALARSWSRTNRVPKVLRAAYGNGEICLVLGYENTTAGDGVLHYASLDGGNSFAEVEDYEDGVGTVLGTAIAYTQGLFVVIFGSAADAGVTVLQAGSAFDLFAELSPNPDPGADFQALIGDSLAMVVDEQGNLIAFGGRNTVTADASETVAFSPDAGRSWAPLHMTAGSVAAPQWCRGESLGMMNLSAAYSRGRIALVGNYGGGTPTFGIVEAQMGGYTTVTMPERSDTVHAALDVTDIAPKRVQVQFSSTWLGFFGALTSFGTWTNADTGAPVYGYSAGYEAIACGAGDESINDLETAATANYYAVIARGSLLQSTGTTRIELRSSRTSGGGNFTRARLQISTTGITLTDDLGAGSATATLTAGLRVDFLVTLGGRNASAWYRYTDGASNRRWTLVGTLANLTEGAGAPNARVRRICRPSSIANWHELCALLDSDEVLDEALADGISNPGHLYGRQASGVAPLYIDDGVSVRCNAGPGYIAETFTMESRGANPIENAFPGVAPSPQIYAELENDDDVDVRLDLFDNPEDMLNDAIGIYIDGAVYGAELWGDDGSGFVKLADLITSVEVAFERLGETVTMPVGGSAVGESSYHEAHELAGGWVCFDPEGADDTRKIVSNTDGYLFDGLLREKRAVLTLTGIDETEDLTGTMQLVYPRSCHVVLLNGAREYQSLKVRINPTGGGKRSNYPAPPWGKIRLHVLAPSSVHFFGQAVARDHVEDRESLATVLEQPSGAKWSRALSGRTRRVVEFSGSSEAVDIAEHRTVQSGQGPDYVKATSTANSEPVASRFDLPLLLSGLLDVVDGPHHPVIWVPRYVVGGSQELGGAVDVQSWNARRCGGAVYGRLTSTARLESVVGTPHGDQIVRGPRFVLVEEL